MGWLQHLYLKDSLSEEGPGDGTGESCFSGSGSSFNDEDSLLAEVLNFWSSSSLVRLKSLSVDDSLVRESSFDLISACTSQNRCCSESEVSSVSLVVLAFLHPFTCLLWLAPLILSSINAFEHLFSPDNVGSLTVRVRVCLPHL